ncbi:unnamed protein product [Bemisia tabaci]|uniref:Uncharacterized protein n=1 Tax=Bemisia tabaci TaxID=7038 RepID=A0A9P0AFA3_BEMTA|nr:unnamed protein product [Bemisia tabaci]
MGYKHKPLLLLLLIALFQVQFSPCASDSIQDEVNVEVSPNLAKAEIGNEPLAKDTGDNVEVSPSPTKAETENGPVDELAILKKQLKEKKAELKNLEKEKESILNEAYRTRARKIREQKKELQPYFQKQSVLNSKLETVWNKWFHASENTDRAIKDLNKKIIRHEDNPQLIAKWEKQLQEKRKERAAIQDEYETKSRPLVEERKANAEFIHARQQRDLEPFKKAEEMGKIIEAKKREVRKLNDEIKKLRQLQKETENFERLSK